MLGCGHQFHYTCACKVKNKAECCICKRPVVCTAKILWKEEIDMYKPLTPNTFYKCVLNTMIYSNIIKKRLLTIQENKNTLIRKVINDYVKENLSLIRTQILSACNNDKSNVLICGHNYGYEYKGFPFVFLLYGPKKEGLAYFERNNITSLSEAIQQELGKEFDACPYRKNNKNYIIVSWRIMLLKR